MSPMESVIASDFEKGIGMVTLRLDVDGLGGINDYSVRIEMPDTDANLKAIAGIVHQVHAAAFAVNSAWEVHPRGD